MFVKRRSREQKNMEGKQGTKEGKKKERTE